MKRTQPVMCFVKGRFAVIGNKPQEEETRPTVAQWSNDQRV